MKIIANVIRFSLQMISFITGLSMANYDTKAIQVPQFTSFIASISWNDMYSWPKEADEYERDPRAYPVNVIPALMKGHFVDREETLGICRRKLLQYELKCLRSTEELLTSDSHPLSLEAR